MVQRCRLLTRAQIGGAVQEPGYEFTLPDGMLGPHRTVVASNHGAQIGELGGHLRDVPLYMVLDADHEKAAEELRAKHAKEIADLDHDEERVELLKRQAAESAELRAAGAKRDLDARHAAEAEDLKNRHEAEARGMEKKEPAQRVIVTIDADMDKLKERQADEDKALTEKHEREREALEAKQSEPAADEPVAEPLDSPFDPAPAPVSQPAPMAGETRRV